MTFEDFKNRLDKATQEEVVVLENKQQNLEYYSDNIKWDSTKIRFAPNLVSDIKFTAPKVEDK